MSFRRTLTAVLVLFVCLAGTAFSTDDKVMQLRVSLDDPAAVRTLRHMGFEDVVVTDQYADVFTDDGGLARIRDRGLDVTIIHEDVAAYYAEMLAEYDGMGGYRTLSEIDAYIDNLVAAHPDLVSSKVSIGLSIEGRDLWAVKISDNPNIDEDEPEVFFNALTHSHEPATAEALIYFMDFLTDNYGTDPQATDIVDNREVWFVLVVNPDGYYYNEVTYPDGGGTWRKNRRPLPRNAYGVDLNRNFGYMWGYDDEGSSPKPQDGNYRGEAPFSEPETQALRDFILAHDFEMIADYHSPGWSFLWPWSYNLTHTPDEEVFQLLADTMRAGTLYQPSGQVVLANGCSHDWHYGEQTIKEKIMTFGIETADGNLWPDPADLPGIVAELLPINILLCRFADSVFLADSVYMLKPPTRPVVHAPEGIQGPEYDVTWSHDDIVNPAVQYELMEYQGPEKIMDSVNNLDYWVVNDVANGFRVSTYEYYSAPSAFLGFVGYGGILASKYPIQVADGDVFTFWTKYELSKGYAYAYVQVSTDGENFESIPGNITTDENPYSYNLGNGITGMKTHWTEAQFDLSAFAGQSIWIRFIGESYKDAGRIQLDDLYPAMRFQTETVIASDLTDTLYSFTDKPDGDYYYRARAKDAQDQWGELSGYGIVNVGATDTYVGGNGIGDTNGDGVVDQLDVAYLIEYLHKDGPAPDPIEAGDANGDGMVNSLDAKYLIEYLHKDGPEPVCP